MFTLVNSQQPLSPTPTSPPPVSILGAVPTLTREAIEKLLRHKMGSNGIMGVVEACWNERERQ
jgi:hypothetical protein